MPDALLPQVVNLSDFRAIFVFDKWTANADGRQCVFHRAMIQGSTDVKNPPYMCASLPNFVELRGGDYFFMPSLTALRLIAHGSVDPR